MFITIIITVVVTAIITFLFTANWSGKKIKQYVAYIEANVMLDLLQTNLKEKESLENQKLNLNKNIEDLKTQVDKDPAIADLILSLQAMEEHVDKMLATIEEQNTEIYQMAEEKGFNIVPQN